MAKIRRANCPICNRSIAVRKDGTLRLHGGGARNPYNPSYCDGSDKKVADDHCDFNELKDSELRENSRVSSS